jgi:hypothetical protein
MIHHLFDIYMTTGKQFFQRLSVLRRFRMEWKRRPSDINIKFPL